MSATPRMRRYKQQLGGAIIVLRLRLNADGFPMAHKVVDHTTLTEWTNEILR
jgi:hypothetical protein